MATKVNKKKYNYAVTRSLLGGLWIGKTKLPLKNNRIFANIDKAKDKAIGLFLNDHPSFDPDVDIDEDTTPMENMEVRDDYDALLNSAENEVEEIRTKMEKFIV